MTEKLTNGDYSSNGGALEFVEYIDEVLQSIALALSTGRGRFYPNKNYGSHINEAVSQGDCERALAYARQALDGFDGVYVKGVQMQDNHLIFNVSVNDIERSVSVGADI